MEWTKKIREDLILDDKDFELMTGSNENEYFFLIMLMMFECAYGTERLGQGRNIKQYIILKELLIRYNKYTLEGIMSTIAKFRMIQDIFQLKFSILIKDYDAYFQSITHEYEKEIDPLLQRRKKQVFDDFNSLNSYIHPVGKNFALPIYYQGTIYFVHSSFPSQTGNHVFNYCKDDIVIVVYLLSSTGFGIKQLDLRLKILFDNITDIGNECEVGGIKYEIQKSDQILSELSEGKNTFHLPFNKIGTVRGINLPRLMKYWEINGDIEIEDWLGDDTGWNIKLIKKGNHQYIKELKIDSVILFDSSEIPITPNQYIIIEKFTKSRKIDVPISHVDLRITKDAFKKNITRLNKSLGGKVRIGKVRGKNLWHFIKGDN